MKIVYLHQYFSTPDRGGATRSFEFARRWVKAGNEVHILCSRSDERARSWQRTEIEGIQVHSVGVPYRSAMNFTQRLRSFSTFAAHASRRARSLEADVVYATSTPLTIVVPAAVATMGTGTPFLFEVRDTWPDVPIALGYLSNPVLRRAALGLERFAYTRASHIVTLAPGMRDDIVAKGINPKKISVVPQGCDLDLFAEGASRAAGIRASQDWLQDRPLVLFAGSINRLAGLTELVGVAQAVADLNPEVRFAVIGDGIGRSEFAELAAAQGLLNRTIFMLGSKPKRETVAWMAASTMTLAFIRGPRELWKNAAQNKFFDSIAAGKPVVTNNAGWQTTVAQANDIGFQIDSRDPVPAAQAIMDHLQDQAWLDGVAQRCRRLAQTEFNRDVQAADVLQLLVQSTGK